VVLAPAQFRADAGGAGGRTAEAIAFGYLKINHEQATLPEQMATFSTGKSFAGCS
jgi:hypothetical protein